MTLVDKLKEKLHIGDHSKSSSSPSVPPKSNSDTSPAVPPKAETNPSLPPKDTPVAGTSTAAAGAVPTSSDPSQSPSTKKDALPSLPEKEVFDHDKVTVIFVLGGPGAGKGTQCEYLVKDYGFVHLSAGDLLRAEQAREGSEYGEMIKQYIVEGQIVPMEVTVKLLENAMRDAISKPPSFPAGSPLSSVWADGKGRFLIDGFPRKMDQALKFDEAVCESSFVLFFATTEKVMLERLLERGKTSGRSDDNEESIKKRFKTFEDTSMPVVDYYREHDKVVEIDSSPEVHVVYENVRAAIDPRLGMTPPKPLAGIPEPIDQSSAVAPTEEAHSAPLQPEGDVPVLARAAV